MSVTESILKASIFTPGRRGWGLPILFWGAPGIGKSDMIEDLGRHFGMHVEVLSPGERGEGAFGVTPVPRTAGEELVITYPKPDWADAFDDSDNCGIVFVDEITTAPPALQAALLGLVQARRIGSHYLGKRIRVVGACNPVNQAAGGWDLAPPVANRFGHVDWSKPSAEKWSAWLLDSDPTQSRKITATNAALEEKRVLGAWSVPFAKAKGLISTFIQRRPELLHQMPNANDPNMSRSWPSHRTWEMATLALTSSEVHALSDEERDLFVASFIGNGAMTELVAFQAANDLPNPADVLDGKTPWEHDPERLDRSMAVFSSCAALVTSDEKSKPDSPRVRALWELMESALDDAADVLVSASRPIMKARLHTDKKAIKVMARLKPILDAAEVE